MEIDYITILYYIMWGLLVFTAVFFFVSGLDDLFFDCYYWIYMAWRLRHLKTRHKLTYEDLAKKPQKRIAVMIACWHEAGVIEDMLRYNSYAIDYQNYELFVGVYPNDPTTVAAVQSIADIFPHVICVVGPQPGPTNKASNLNSIYTFISEYEKKHGIQYDIFVMHDSEDVIHPYSFLLYNYLTPKNNMIQIPVFPLQVKLTEFTHWTYGAEFSEIHTKDIIVREKIGGLVPSAGVGTAFTRETMEMLKSVRGGVPFSVYSLTEDYSTALEIRLRGLKQIFVLQHVYRTDWRKRWYFFGKLVPYRAREYIATRALFPLTYFTSVRQKTRWILGISFQEVIHTGWKGNLAVEYTLLHDRKALFTHLVNGLFFIQVPFWLLYMVYSYNIPDLPTLQDSLLLHPWVISLIGITSILMINRFLQRAISVYRLYGLMPALLSIPLILYANIINMHSLFRAYYQFFAPAPKATTAGGSTVKWDKTDHSFPVSNSFTTHKMRLGNLLLKENLINRENLLKALNEQTQSGEQLGKVLLRNNFINQKQLIEVLAKQYHMKIVPQEDVHALTSDKLPHISKFRYDWLINHELIPIDLDDMNVVIAIRHLKNEKQLIDVQHLIKPYHAVFCLIGET